MKLFLCAFMVLLSGVCSNVIKNDDKIKVANKNDIEATYDIKTAFNEIFKQKCDKIGGEDAYDKFIGAVGTTFECVKTRFPQKNESDDSSSSEELCVYKNKNLRDCFTDLIEFMKDCSEPEEKYLPDFLFDAFDGVMDLLCVDNKLAGLANPDSVECLESVLNDDSILNVCSDKVSLETLNSEKDCILTKSELCSDLKTVHGCYDTFLAKRCPKDKEVKKVLNAIFNAISSPCNKSMGKPVPRLLF